LARGREGTKKGGEGGKREEGVKEEMKGADGEGEVRMRE
jgi:hypothetical protein